MRCPYSSALCKQDTHVLWCCRHQGRTEGQQAAPPIQQAEGAAQTAPPVPCPAAQSKARILLDIGSSNCFVDRSLAAGLLETGKTFNANMAKRGAFLTSVPEVLRHVQTGDDTAEVPALMCRYPMALMPV